MIDPRRHSSPKSDDSASPAIFWYARLTLAFSKKSENQVYAFAPHTMHYNFVKIGGAHRMSPAQAADVDSRFWEISKMVAMIEEWEAKLSIQ